MKRLIASHIQDTSKWTKRLALNFVPGKLSIKDFIYQYCSKSKEWKVYLITYLLYELVAVKNNFARCHLTVKSQFWYIRSGARSYHGGVPLMDEKTLSTFRWEPVLGLIVRATVDLEARTIVRTQAQTPLRLKAVQLACGTALQILVGTRGFVFAKY